MPKASSHYPDYFRFRLSKRLFAYLSLLIGLTAIGVQVWFVFSSRIQADIRSRALDTLTSFNDQLSQDYQTQIASLSAELTALKTEDQKVKNDHLQDTISQIEKVYVQSVSVYEELIKLRAMTRQTDTFDAAYTKAPLYLADHNYASASATLALLKDTLKDEQAKLAASLTPPDNVVTDNNLPVNGYKTQWVSSDVGMFRTAIVAADLASTRVIVDTASDNNCGNDCPVLPLASYVSRSGAYAGINGSYFCPASYPSCAGKTNSFDTLLMNKNKTYFNSDNNVYSTVPVAVFGSGWARFIGQSLEWGRDTSVDAVIANQPLMVANNQVVFGGDGDPKKGSKSNRSFVAVRGSTTYIGVVFGATVAQAAHVLKTLGMDHALNLDSGGSTALWSGGYKAGPGRNIPNAILFVRK